MKSLRTLLLVLLSVGVAAPAAAWPGSAGRRGSAAWGEGVNASDQPGSVLVFPKYRDGTATTLDQGTLPRTEFEISVVCPTGFSCMFGQEARLKAHWVCRGEEDADEPDFRVCRESDFELSTTVNGTLFLTTEDLTVVNQRNGAFTRIPQPPCEDVAQAYLILWVIDAFGNAIKADALIGDAILRGGPGPRACETAGNTTCAESYNAIPIQAAEDLSIGEVTDRDGEGDLDFDGSEYKMLTGVIIGTVRYPGSTVNNAGLTTGSIQTVLTLLTLDVRSNRVNDVTSVDLNFYNEGEDVHSTSTTFVCYKTQQLSDLDPFLTNSFGRKGLVVSAPAEQNGVPVTVLGLLETQEFIFVINVGRVQVREYATPLHNDGTPVATTFVPNEP
jgi:hypothetical protein